MMLTQETWRCSLKWCQGFAHPHPTFSSHQGFQQCYQAALGEHKSEGYIAFKHCFFLTIIMQFWTPPYLARHSANSVSLLAEYIEFNDFWTWLFKIAAWHYVYVSVKTLALEIKVHFSLSLSKIAFLKCSVETFKEQTEGSFVS